MRFASAWWLGILAAAAAVCAAPVKTPDAAKSPFSGEHEYRAESLHYARYLAVYVERIEEAYVRPVKPEDLYVAALEGLYEAVGAPVPAGLRADVREGIKNDLVGTLVRVREGLGQHEALRGQNALMVSLRALPRVLDSYCGMTPRYEFQRLDLTEGTLNAGLEFVGVPLAPAGQVGGPGHFPNDPNGTAPSGQPPRATGPLRVQSVNPGSPAQRAGLRPDDLVIRLDGNPPESAAFATAFERLRPVPSGTSATSGTKVRLTVRRAGRAVPFDVDLEPAEYHTESVYGVRRKLDGVWDYMLDPESRIGYVRLGGIRNQSADEIRDALSSLGLSGVRGLVLDLRWCPGGMLDEAIVIARLLLPRRLPPSMPVYFRCDRSGDPTPTVAPEVRQLLPESFTDFPIVVLVNGETSGGGELIAAALQDHGRAVVAGQRTVGKASIQSRPPKLDIPFKVTMYTFLRPSRKPLQRFPDSTLADDWGVRPDEGRELPLTPEAGRRLKEWWVVQTLRPPGDVEALPLDDPENDPQRLAAVHMLREMIKSK
jgi:carboxyl-terminal processing protease